MQRRPSLAGSARGLRCRAASVDAATFGIQSCTLAPPISTHTPRLMGAGWQTYVADMLPIPVPAIPVTSSRRFMCSSFVGVARNHQYRGWRGGVWPGAGPAPAGGLANDPALQQRLAEFGDGPYLVVSDLLIGDATGRGPDTAWILTLEEIEQPAQ